MHALGQLEETAALRYTSISADIQCIADASCACERVW